MSELKLKERIEGLNKTVHAYDELTHEVCGEIFEIITQLQEIIEIQEAALIRCKKRTATDYEGNPYARIHAIDICCAEALEKTKEKLG